MCPDSQVSNCPLVVWVCEGGRGRKPQETLGLWQSSPVKLNPPSLSSTNGVRCFWLFCSLNFRLDSTEHEELSTFLLLSDFYLVFKYAGRPMTQGDMVPPCTTLHWRPQPSWQGQHPNGLQGTYKYKWWQLNVDFSWTAEGLQGASPVCILIINIMAEVLAVKSAKYSP